MENQIKGAAERWGLNRCEENLLTSHKSSLIGGSERFGLSLLKIDGNISRLKIRASDADGAVRQHSCRVYAYDENAGLLLEERHLSGDRTAQGSLPGNADQDIFPDIP